MGFFLSLINPVSAIAKQIAQYEIAKQNAQTDQARIEADKQIAALQAKQAVLVAESNSPGNIIMRAWLAFPPSFIVAKILIWDKTVGGTTTLSPDLWRLIWIVYGFYFVDKIVNRLKA